VLTTEHVRSYQILIRHLPYISYSLVWEIDCLVSAGSLPRLLQLPTIHYSINIIFLTPRFFPSYLNYFLGCIGFFHQLSIIFPIFIGSFVNCLGFFRNCLGFFLRHLSFFMGYLGFFFGYLGFFLGF
jgi:hypothetical protein